MFKREIANMFFPLVFDLMPGMQMLPPRQGRPAGHGKAFAAQWRAGRVKPVAVAITRQLLRQQNRLEKKGRKDKNYTRRYAY